MSRPWSTVCYYSVACLDHFIICVGMSYLPWQGFFLTYLVPLFLFQESISVLMKTYIRSFDQQIFLRGQLLVGSVRLSIRKGVPAPAPKPLPPKGTAPKAPPWHESKTEQPKHVP